MAVPVVTVVLPTFRRPDALARAMSALASQEDPGVEWELIVVDNDEAPGVEATVHALAPAIPAAVMVLREARRGAAHARNTGIDAAKGDVVAFIDDDVVAAPTWLAALTAPILEGRSKGAGGPVQLDPAVPLPRWVSKDWRGCLSEFARRGEERGEHELGRGDFVLTASA